MLVYKIFVIGVNYKCAYFSALFYCLHIRDIQELSGRANSKNFHRQLCDSSIIGLL